MKAGFATVLDNVFPTAGDVRLRAGRESHATGTGLAKTLMSWESPTAAALFAATDTGIFDVTAPGAVGAPAAVLTKGRCQWVNFRTSGASSLLVVNGQDSMQVYNGSAWAADAAIPIDPVSGGGNLSTSDVSNIHVFKRRLFFIRKDTLDFYYLPIDSIGVSDTVLLFPLGGLFNRGGSLVAMASWTIDSGSGADDLAVFITSKGQAAVYAGTNPSDASAWALQGVYDLAEPLGAKALYKFGGDLLYLSRSGLFPLSKALQDSGVELAVSDVIGPTFNESAAAFGGNDGWELVVDAPNSLILVNVPTAEDSTAVQYVMNTTTKAWCRFTGWDALSWVYHTGRLYMGTADGVSKALLGLTDSGSPIVGLARTHFDFYGKRGVTKTWKMVHPHLEVSNPGISVEVGLDVDFVSLSDYEPLLEFNLSSAIWGDDGPIGPADALYDSADWAEETDRVAPWVTVSAPTGYSAAIRLRLTGESATVSWSAVDVMFEEAGLL